MKQANSFDELYSQIRLRKGAFLIVFAVIVTITYSFLYVIDFYPEPIGEEAVAQDTEELAVARAKDDVIEEVAEEEVDPVVEEVEEMVGNELVVTTATNTTEPRMVEAAYLPRRIIFDAIDGKVVPVLNPTSRTVEDLDTALLSGTVRHPDSADYSADGNVFILGHSSYLPNVFNKNFQAFNGIQNMTWGDRIRVQTDTTEYTYRVQEVYKGKAEDLFIPNTPGEARLTLATCNSFGAKEDRFIVEAVLIDQKSL